MTLDPIAARVLAIAAGVAGPERTPPAVGASTRLEDDGFWLDSIELFEVLVACDEALGPFSPPLAETPEVLETIGSLAAAIRARSRRDRPA